MKEEFPGTNTRRRRVLLDDLQWMEQQKTYALAELEHDQVARHLSESSRQTHRVLVREAQQAIADIKRKLAAAD